MECRQVRELLSDYIDNLTSNEDSAAIKAHLAQCAGCNAEYEELLNIVTLLSELPEKELPHSFDIRLHEALTAVNAEKQNECRNRVNYKNKKLLKHFTSIAAIFVVGLFACTMYNNGDELIHGITDESERNAPVVSELPVKNDEESNDEVKSIISAADSYVSYQDNTYNAEKATAYGMEAYATYGAADDALTVSESESDVYNSDLTGDIDRSGTDGDAGESSGDASQTSSRGGNVITAYDKLIHLYSTDGAIFKGRDPAAIKFYSELLDETLKDIDFEIVSCEKNDGIWVFKVDTVSTDEDGNEVCESAVYNGQDGTLWKEEVTEQTAEETIEESL